VTGDEPHYLVMADGLLPTLEIEQSGPYIREFRTRTIYPGGLAPREAVPDENNTHAVAGPRGLFNVHNLGLPVILAAPYLVLGELGARLTMIAVGAGIVSLLTLIALSAGLDRRRVYLIVTPLVVGLPLLPASTQIYPDLPAGLFSLVVLISLLQPELLARRSATTLTTFSLAFLPWLHLRFVAISLLGLVAIVWTRRSSHSLLRNLMEFAAPLAMSTIMLGTYNWYAFGSPAGPYETDDVQTTTFTAMQFFSLLTDQNQGLLVQQPLHLIGLVMLGGLLRTHLVPILTAAAFTVVSLGINSTHWALYGGWSFNGRFGWTAFTSVAVITLLSLAELNRRFPRLTKVVLAIGALVQSRYLVGLFVNNVDLMPRDRDAWVGTYSIFWSTVEPALPVWTEVERAFRNTPNIVTVLLCVVLIVVGFSAWSTLRMRLLIAGAALLSTITVAAGYAIARVSDPLPRQWNGSALPAEIGSVNGPARIATRDDQTGWLTFGPYWRVRSGNYEVTLTYTASAERTPSITAPGTFEVYSRTVGQKLAEEVLTFGDEEARDLSLRISIDEESEGQLEFRTRYGGEGSLTVWSITIAPSRVQAGST